MMLPSLPGCYLGTKKADWFLQHQHVSLVCLVEPGEQNRSLEWLAVAVVVRSGRLQHVSSSLATGRLSDTKCSASSLSTWHVLPAPGLESNIQTKWLGKIQSIDQLLGYSFILNLPLHCLLNYIMYFILLKIFLLSCYPVFSRNLLEQDQSTQKGRWKQLV